MTYDQGDLTRVISFNQNQNYHSVRKIMNQKVDLENKAVVMIRVYCMLNNLFDSQLR